MNYKYFFIYSIPAVLLLMFGALKFAKWLVRVVDKRIDIRGDNHAAIIVILVMLPNVLHQIIHTVFGVFLIKSTRAEFKYTTIAGIALGVVYLVLAEFIEPWINKKEK